MTHNSSEHLFKLVIAVALLVSPAVPISTNVARGQRLSESPRIFGGPERKLYNGVPAKLPLTFDVRNVTSGKWIHDLEIEVTNTADKPIYYMDMRIFLIGAKSPAGGDISFWLKYGRIQLISVSEPLVPEDVPIKPGEKHIFKISEADARSWDILRTKESRAEPKHLKILFQNINFGDGTGFTTTSGKPVNIHRKVNRAGPSLRMESCFANYLVAENGLPAILPVKFYGEETIKEFPAIAWLLLQGGCPLSGCQNIKPSFFTCGRICDAESDRPGFTSFGCNTDPECACRHPVDTPTVCYDPGTGLPLTCQDVTIFDCFEGSGPEEGDACFDNIDNDGDGFIDCQEPACMSENTFEGPYYPAGGGIDCYLCNDGHDNDCDGSEDTYDFDCAQCYGSPILIDTAGNGFNLTNAENGVSFDLDADGASERRGWTEVGSDDAWLALDRNGNGSIENGQELFGNFTPQPAATQGERNGFLALAEYDKPQSGGNADGKINPNDAIFTSLRLWKDTNHNGFSESSELHTLQQVGLSTIELDYKESRRTDQFGNQFRYRAKVKDRKNLQLGRWAWDVFLVRA